MENGKRKVADRDLHAATSKVCKDYHDSKKHPNDMASLGSGKFFPKIVVVIHCPSNADTFNQDRQSVNLCLILTSSVLSEGSRDP